MSLSRANSIIAGLAENDPFFSKADVICWEKKLEKLTIYVFSKIFQDEQALTDGYKILRDHIAVSFQTQSSVSDAERWNLYIMYIVTGKVSVQLKQEIEQDKFSTRKIVCDAFPSDFDDATISTLISQELFEFRISERKVAGSSLNTLMLTKYPAVYKSLSALGNADTYESIDPLLELLKDE